MNLRPLQGSLSLAAAEEKKNKKYCFFTLIPTGSKGTSKMEERPPSDVTNTQRGKRLHAHMLLTLQMLPSHGNISRGSFHKKKNHWNFDAKTPNLEMPVSIRCCPFGARESDFFSSFFQEPLLVGGGRV